jgi:hypothetical protein
MRDDHGPFAIETCGWNAAAQGRRDALSESQHEGIQRHVSTRSIARHPPLASRPPARPPAALP